jgi:CheY-like chemotaxis protein
MPAIRLLLVEDSDDDAVLLETALRREKLDVEIERVFDEGSVRAALARTSSRIDVVVADWIVPGMSPLEVLDIVAAADPDLPVILVSGVLREEEAVQALRSGACDFIVKSRLSRLAPAIRREAAAATRRREERALRERVEVVERLACVGVLARSLVHDLNGGLAVFSSNVEYALDAPDSKDATDALRDARAAASRLTETVESLRAFTSVGEGASVLDARRVLVAATRLVKVGIGAELALDLREVPAIHASEALLIQLFYTLLLAAVGEGARDQSAPPVSVVLQPGADGVKLTVGPLKSRNLDPAEQLARDVRESLSRHLATALGGRMTTDVQDADGGKTWTITLPSSPVESPAPPLVAPRAHRDLTELRVLVVDDDAIVCRTLARVLWPAHVVTTAKAIDALEVIARDGPFDAVLCDLVMEPIDGVRFLELLMRVSPEHASRLAFLTGAADRASIERQFPGVSIVHKPFAAEEVRGVVGAISAVGTRA